MNFRVIGRHNGENIFCIAVSETDEAIVTLFPMVIRHHTVSTTPNSIRETYSAAQMCPFTDDRLFAFYKPELQFIKVMNEDAVQYYIHMLNKHETPELLKKYNLNSIIQQEEVVDQTERDDAEFQDRLEEILEDSEEDTIVKGRVLH